jgi:hypothetical protein
MTKDDFVIICGDFGGVWNYLGETNDEKYWLDWLNDKPFTTLFVDGNHENFSRLNKYPRMKYHGGMVHKIRDSVLHLMRGYVFDFEGKRFFTFGGASSHDIKDGILNPDNYPSLSDCAREYNLLTRFGHLVRIKGISWWQAELPSKSEMDRGIKNLEKVGYDVDFVVTHCLPLRVSSLLYFDDSDKLTRYYDKLLDSGLKFDKWYAGHYHASKQLQGKYEILYENILRIV